MDSSEPGIKQIAHCFYWRFYFACILSEVEVFRIKNTQLLFIYKRKKITIQTRGSGCFFFFFDKYYNYNHTILTIIISNLRINTCSIYGLFVNLIKSLIKSHFLIKIDIKMYVNMSSIITKTPFSCGAENRRAERRDISLSFILST